MAAHRARGLGVLEPSMLSTNRSIGTTGTVNSAWWMDILKLIKLATKKLSDNLHKDPNTYKKQCHNRKNGALLPESLKNYTLFVLQEIGVT